MKKEEVLKQIRKYGINKTFENVDLFNYWFNQLDYIEKQNIMSLDIEPKKIPFLKEYLINEELLNTLDYNKKVKALATVKNAEGWYHLYPNILTKEFLDSANFYKDIYMMSKAETAQYCLWILGDSNFIKSPYHDEDLRLIVETKDVDGPTEYGYDLSFVVWDSLATTAVNIDSIKSRYHEEDMIMIANTGSSKLQTVHSYPRSTISYLANNKESLNSDNHISNMHLLVDNDNIGNYLYSVMTNKKFINNAHYYSLIHEMIEHQNNLNYVILLCIYAVDIQETEKCNINFFQHIFRADLNELLKEVEFKLDMIDGECKDIETNPKNNLFLRVKQLLKK